MNKMAILTAIYQLSRADRQVLFVDWMTQEGQAKAVVNYLELGLDLNVIRYNKKILTRLSKGVWSYIDTNGETRMGNMKRIMRFRKMFRKNMALTPTQVAERHVRNAKLPSCRYNEVLDDAQGAKKTVTAKQRYLAKKNGKVRKYERGNAPSNGNRVDAVHLGNGSETVQTLKTKIITVSNEPVLTVSRKPITELERVVAPYREVFETPVLLKVVDELIKTFERYLDIPSMFVKKGSSYEVETKSARLFPEWYAAMKDTSLFDHTCNVVANAIELTKQTFSEAGYRNLIPMVITTALAHDIGKIDEFRNNSPVRTHGHPRVSAEHLKTLFHGIDVTWLDQAINAILLHHVGPKDKNDAVAKILFDADTMAREDEMTGRGIPLVRKPISKWLDLKELTQAVLPAINVLKGKNKRWQAITHGSVVYCMYGHILNTVIKLSEEKGILDYRFVRKAIQENIEVLKEVVDILRDNGYLGWKISAGHYYRRLKISVNNENIPNQIFDLIPIRADMFDMTLSDIETRKTDYLKLIHDIRSADNTGF